MTNAQDAETDRVTLLRGGYPEVVARPATEGDIYVARVRDPAGNLIGPWQFTG